MRTIKAKEKRFVAWVDPESTIFSQRTSPLNISTHPQFKTSKHSEQLDKGVEECSHTGNGKGNPIGNGSTGAGASGRRAGAGAGTSLAARGGRVISGGLAGVSALDDIAAHLVEGAAIELAVAGLQVEATTDLGEGTELNTIEE